MKPEYEEINEKYVRRSSDGAFIPKDERNADYQKYLEWLSNQEK